MWRVLDRGSTVAWVLGFFKWPALAVAMFFAGIYAVWSFYLRLPPPVIMLGFLVAIMATLLIVNLAISAWVRFQAARFNAARRQHASAPLPWSHLGETREITASHESENVELYDGMIVVRRSATTPFTLNLPLSPAAGRLIDIAKGHDDQSEPFIVSGNGRMIAGGPSYILAVRAQSITVRYSGTEWIIL